MNSLELALPLYSYIIAANLLLVFLGYETRILLRGYIVDLMYLSLIASTVFLIFSVAIQSKALAILGIIIIVCCYFLTILTLLFLLGIRIKLLFITNIVKEKYEKKIEGYNKIQRRKCLMKWRDLPLKAKWALSMMVVAIFPGLAGITISVGVFGKSPSLFVYVLPVIWLILFLISMVRLRTGLIGAIVLAVINLFILIVIILMGIKSPIADALGIPICPFAIIGMVISAAVIYLSVKAYREL